jgi:hypothetical protein
LFDAEAANEFCEDPAAGPNCCAAIDRASALGATFPGVPAAALPFAASD